eukprot:scaffold493334_cov20-Prasinocladus_malaysianus.AAC.1
MLHHVVGTLERDYGYPYSYEYGITLPRLYRTSTALLYRLSIHLVPRTFKNDVSIVPYSYRT